MSMVWGAAFKSFTAAPAPGFSSAICQYYIPYHYSFLRLLQVLSPLSRAFPPLLLEIWPHRPQKPYLTVLPSGFEALPFAPLFSFLAFTVFLAPPSSWLLPSVPLWYKADGRKCCSPREAYSHYNGNNSTIKRAPQVQASFWNYSSFLKPKTFWHLIQNLFIFLD